MNTIYIQDSEMKRLAKSIFSYKGRKFKVVTQTHYKLHNYWDGGSKTDMVLCDREGKVHNPNSVIENPYNKESQESFEIPKNHFIIEHNIIQGKDCGSELLDSHAVA